MDKCILDSERDCIGRARAEEVAGDVRALDRRIDDLQNSISKTNSNFGGRIGKLEARDEVRDEQYKHVREKLDGITRDMEDFQRENKNSVAELRKEHKESMSELKKGNKEILDAVTPLTHKVADLESLKKEVEKLKEKPANTWEFIKSHALAWIIGAVLCILAYVFGVKQYI